jgi:hypothetical protein
VVEERDLGGFDADGIYVVADAERGEHVAAVGRQAQERAFGIAGFGVAFVDRGVDAGTLQSQRNDGAGHAGTDYQGVFGARHRSVSKCLTVLE